MGKGDLRSKRGKIHRGTYGNTRRKKSKKQIVREPQEPVSKPPPRPAGPTTA
ncbi:MAG: 30S ribosomal protein THX [Gemmatimonadales bacterium]